MSAVSSQTGSEVLQHQVTNLSKQTLVDVFWRRVQEAGHRRAMMYKVQGQWVEITWKEQGDIVRKVANGLLKNGIVPGDKAAIMSQTRAHWTWADVAILSCGGVSVPIYPTLSPPEVQYLVRHSDSTVLFAETAAQAKKIIDAAEVPPFLKLVVVMEGQAPESTEQIKCMTWDELVADGVEFAASNPEELQKRIEGVQPSQMASIIYTSGTTGVPKGAMLLHSNFMSVCKAVSEKIGFTQEDLALSFLPLSHVYERAGGEFLSIYTGLVIAYAESIEAVPKNIGEVKPTVLNGVPRFYEKAYQRVQTQIKQMSKPRQILIKWAFSLGRKATKIGSNSGLMHEIYRGELRVADRLVFAKIRQRFGGRLRILASGAAPLAQEVQAFFETIGFTMLEGYGLTETSAPLCCNTPEANHRGTVGRPISGVELKIAEDGEILAKGPTIFAGYYKNEEATNEALSDGWFHTGDIGEFDSDGFLRIKDRKKDIIITAGGKHIAPQYIENLFKGKGMVSNILVYGDRRKYVTALITLNPDSLTAFAQANSIATTDLAELSRHELVRASVEELVAAQNEHLAQFEKIKKYTILPADFSAENNELTPTFKVKRKVVTEKYKQILDSMYDVEDIELEGGTPAQPVAK